MAGEVELRSAVHSRQTLPGSAAQISRARTRRGKLRSSSQPRRRPAQLRGWQLTFRGLSGVFGCLFRVLRGLGFFGVCKSFLPVFGPFSRDSAIVAWVFSWGLGCVLPFFVFVFFWGGGSGFSRFFGAFAPKCREIPPPKSPANPAVKQSAPVIASNAVSAAARIFGAWR